MYFQYLTKATYLSAWLVDNNIVILENYADIQLTRNFIWSLINLKNTKETMTLEDHYILMTLFLERIDANRKNVATQNKIDTIAYIEYQKELLSVFDVYLKKVYKEHVSFKLSNIENFVLSDAFSKEEKDYFYQISNNLKWMNENRETIFTKDKDEENLKLEMKVFYK